MQDDTKVQVPDTTGLKMKMPENTTSQPTETSTEPSVVNGPLLAVLALLLIIILGGMYYWFGTLSTDPQTSPAVLRPTAEENNEPESTTAEAQADISLTTSPSDELSAIEADLESTNLDTLDSELQSIDAEINAAIQ